MMNEGRGELYSSRTDGGNLELSIQPHGWLRIGALVGLVSCLEVAVGHRPSTLVVELGSFWVHVTRH